jgi:hypothetical protein
MRSTGAVRTTFSFPSPGTPPASDSRAGLTRATPLIISISATSPGETVWYSDPAGFGNTLNVNGPEIPNGSLVAYDATTTCVA